MHTHFVNAGDSVHILLMMILAINTSKMKTIFLDTQSHIYITEKCDHIEQAAFIKISQSGNFTLVGSIYNLVEFAKSQNEEQSIALTAIFDKMPTLWGLDFYEIQMNELYQFIFKNYYNFNIQQTKKLKQFNELHDRCFNTPEDFVLTARKQIFEFEKTFSRSAKALDTLTRHGKLNTNTENAALYNGLIQKMDRIELSGRFFPVVNKRAIASDIVKNKKKLFFKENISAATEIHLSDYRSSNKNRFARNSDAIDLVSSVSIFPYVDIFVSNDGFLKNGLEYVKKQLSIKTKIYRKISEIPF